MKPIGGELALNSPVEELFFTDSGRSSLRLFIRSGNRDKKFLIPDFLCQIIEDVLIQEKVTYEFYKINSDLSIDKDSISHKKYDIFYLINYFGELQNIDNLDINDKIVIEDNVFFYDFKNHNNFKKWFAFNSFRKITSFADGSLVKTNLDIDDSHIEQTEAKFVEKKYEAKQLKYDYLNNTIGNENDYLRLFEDGEQLINQQLNIFQMSTKSLFQMMLYDKVKQSVSKKYYELFYNEFKLYCLNDNVEFYSFFVMKTVKRDELRKYLFSKNIFLPIHWPKSSQDNILYDEVISIPLFSMYSIDEMKYIISSIKEFYEKN